MMTDSMYILFHDQMIDRFLDDITYLYESTNDGREAFKKIRKKWKGKKINE